MGITNFEHSLNTLASAIQSGTECNVIVKRIDTGYYKYTAGINYEPHRGMNVYVTKESLTGMKLGIVYIDKITSHGLEYRSTKHKNLRLQNKDIIIPERIVKELVRFYKALALKMNWAE